MTEVAILREALHTQLVLIGLSEHGRFRCRHHLIRKRRGHHLVTAQLEGDNTGRFLTRRLTIGEACDQVGDAAPAGEHAEILLTIDLIGHGRRRCIANQLV